MAERQAAAAAAHDFRNDVDDPGADRDDAAMTAASRSTFAGEASARWIPHAGGSRCRSRFIRAFFTVVRYAARRGRNARGLVVLPDHPMTRKENKRHVTFSGYFGARPIFVA